MNGRIDLLGCNLTEDGNSLLETLEELTNVNVSGSSDLTGSELLGGDWLLESDNIDVELEYFDPQILSKWDSTLEGLEIDVDAFATNLIPQHEVHIDQEVQIAIQLTSELEEDKGYTLDIKVQNPSGVIIEQTAQIINTLEPNGNQDHTFTWTPAVEGQHTLSISIEETSVSSDALPTTTNSSFTQLSLFSVSPDSTESAEFSTIINFWNPENSSTSNLLGADWNIFTESDMQRGSLEKLNKTGDTETIVILDAYNSPLPLDKVSIGQTVQIGNKLSNNNTTESELNYEYSTVITDADGNQNLDNKLTGSIPVEESIFPLSSWTPTETGNYTVTLSVKDLEEEAPFLSRESQITVISDGLIGTESDDFLLAHPGIRSVNTGSGEDSVIFLNSYDDFTVDVPDSQESKISLSRNELEAFESYTPVSLRETTPTAVTLENVEKIFFTDYSMRIEESLVNTEKNYSLILEGSENSDLLNAKTNISSVEAGAGIDMVVFAGKYQDYTIEKDKNSNSIRVINKSNEYLTTVF